MSYSTLYRVCRTHVEVVRELRNGWGTAPPLWEHLSQTYLGCSWGAVQGRLDDLWDLSRDPRVPLDLRIAHAMTFDGAIVRRGGLEAAAAACLAASSVVPEHQANHWPTLARLMVPDNTPDDPDFVGLGLACTSVADPWADATPEKISEAFDAVEYASQDTPNV